MGIVGQIVLWPGQRTPKGWLACDGAEFGVSSAPQLWEVIGQTYGSGGRSFGHLPDLGDRRAIGSGETPEQVKFALGSSGMDSSPDGDGILLFDLPSIISAEGTAPSSAPGSPLGTIIPFAGKTPPKGFMFCDGRLLSARDHKDLFDVLGGQFGGDGRADFALPDFRGRAPIGFTDSLSPGARGRDKSTIGPYGYLTINYAIAVELPREPSAGDGVRLLGEIVYTGATVAGEGWAFCLGQLLSVKGNEQLFSLIGTTFGGGGEVFALPNLERRMVIGTGQPIGHRSSLSGVGDGEVRYLTVQSLIATEGIEPEFD